MDHVETTSSDIVVTVELGTEAPDVIKVYNARQRIVLSQDANSIPNNDIKHN